MQTLPVIVILLQAWILGAPPAIAGDAPQPPAAVARDIEILNRMFQQRKIPSSIQEPPAATLPATPSPTKAAPGDARVAPLIAKLADESTAARERARWELVKIGGPAVPDLILALQDTELRVRIEAARALGSIKDARAAQPLADLLEEQSQQLWEAVFGAMVALGPVAEPALLDALGSHDWTPRWRAVNLLGEIRGPQATDALIALLNKDRSTGVRVEIAEALRKIKDRAACDALLDALHDW